MVVDVGVAVRLMEPLEVPANQLAFERVVLALEEVLGQLELKNRSQRKTIKMSTAKKNENNNDVQWETRGIWKVQDQSQERLHDKRNPSGFGTKV